MAEHQKNRDVYGDLQSQWPGMQSASNPCVQPIINQQLPTNGNFQQPQDHFIQNHYPQPDLFPNHIFAPKNDHSISEESALSGDNQGNFNENAYINQNANFEGDGTNPQGYACFKFGNGQVLKTHVIYDENNQQYIVPLNNYDIYNQNLRHNVNMPQNYMPMMMNYPNMAASMPHQVSTNLPQIPTNMAQQMPQNLCPMMQGDNSTGIRREPQLCNLPRMNSVPTPDNTTQSYTENVSNDPVHQSNYEPPSSKNHLIDHFLGNWTGNPSGTYTPFGHAYVNVQPNTTFQREAPASSSNLISAPTSHVSLKEPEALKPEQFNRKEEGILLPEAVTKKRIVAEVKPMRPTYSAILSKTPNGQTNVDKKTKNANKEINKSVNAKLGQGKSEKIKGSSVNVDRQGQADEKCKKFENNKKSTFLTQQSSGSESGDAINVEFTAKTEKKNIKMESNGGKRWISLEDLTNENDTPPVEETPRYTNCDSEFVFVTQNEEKGPKKRNAKKAENNQKKNEKSQPSQDQSSTINSEQFSYQDHVNDNDKIKKKSKENRVGSNKTNRPNSEKNKRNAYSKLKKNKGVGYFGLMQTYLDNWISLMISVMFWFCHLLTDIFSMSTHLIIDLFSTMRTETCIWGQNAWTIINQQISGAMWLCNLGNYIDKKVGHTRFGFWRKLKWFKSLTKPETESETQKQNNFNIPLPATGDDAMKRLLAFKGKDPYSILGVGVQCSDDDIKRYYRRQAFLVHPDKNQQPGAEEAFKILQHAFDLIGEPERREAYDRKLLESQHVEAAWSELSELLAQLHDKVKHAAGTIRCTNCSRRHKRTLTPRPCYAARYCAQCKIHHSAKEGDIWAESTFWGIVWMYYACMDGAIYEITQWASCQKKNLKHLKANTHHVQYRIVLGNKSQGGPSAGKANTNSSAHDANLEDFLNNLYTKAGQPTPGPTGKNNSATHPGENVKTKRKANKTFAS